MQFDNLSGRERITSRFCLCVAIVVLSATVAHAGNEPAAVAGPFVRGTVGLEFGLGLLDEAWNLNGNREWLVDGRFSVWWAFLDRATLAVDFHGTGVFQQPSRNAFVTGVTPGIRFQIIRGKPWDVFAEIGVGPSWSDTAVPPRGTRFNYLGYTGVGLSRRLGRQVHGIAGFRWLHMSNNGREGHHRNPDIQALGGYAAMNVGF